MSADVSIKFHGLNGLNRAIQRLPEELKKRAYRSVVSTGARVIAKNAKKRIKNDSGILKKSIDIKVPRNNTQVAIIGTKRGIGGVVNGRQKWAVNYAKNVEFGTANTAARPFLRPAIDNSKAEVLQKMTNGLSRFLTRAAASVKKGGGK